MRVYDEANKHIFWPYNYEISSDYDYMIIVSGYKTFRLKNIEQDDASIKRNVMSETDDCYTYIHTYNLDGTRVEQDIKTYTYSLLFPTIELVK